MDLHAALDKLLAGTGIEIASDDGQTIILRGLSKNAEAAPSEGAAPIETVTVTGSHVPGEPISPLITIDRTAIVNSGYANTAELMRTLPQNFGGGIQPTTLGTLGESTNNISSASTLNLRGLGAESTLTLIDGHRIASDGFVGGVVDVSAIPLAAVDHVEVLTDGASAIYGADAVGGVVNFILRQDYDGAQSSGQIGTSTQGGGTQYEGSQLVGKNWGSGGAMLNYEYSRQDILLGGHRSFSSATPQPFTLVPEEDRSSLFGTVHQDLTSDVSVFAEGLYTFRTGSDIETIPGYYSYYNKYRSEIYAFNFGADWQIDQDWHANVTGTISHDHSKGETYLNIGGPLAGGDNYDNGMYAVEALVNGTVEGLPTGDISVALAAAIARRASTAPGPRATSTATSITYSARRACRWSPNRRTAKAWRSSSCRSTDASSTTAISDRPPTPSSACSTCRSMGSPCARPGAPRSAPRDSISRTGRVRPTPILTSITRERRRVRRCCCSAAPTAT